MTDRELISKVSEWKSRIDKKLYSNNNVRDVTKRFLVSLLEDLSEEMGDTLK